MKNSVHIFILLFLILPGCTHVDCRPKWKGPVRSVKEISFQLDTTQTEPVKLRRMRWQGGGSDFTLSFDRNGNPVQKKEYSFNDLPTAHYEYIYNKEELLTSKIELNVQGQVLRIWRYEYEGSRCVSELECSADSSIVLRHFNEYEDEKLSHRTTCFATGSVSHFTVFGYDKYGKTVSEQLLSSDRQPLKRITYSYNNQGDKISESKEDLLTGENLTDWRYTYTYDSIGNWISCIEFFDGIPVYMLERTIEYY